MKPLLFILLFSTGLPSTLQGANTLLFNGKIHTEVGQPTFDWILIKNNRVHSYGKGSPPTLDPKAEKTDLAGRHVFPGLTDAHAHISDIGREKFQIDLKGTKSSEEAVERLRTALKTKPVHSPSAIIGNGWDQSDWPGQKFPTRETLDSISTSQPILLYRIDGHAAWVNTYALKESKIWNATGDPKGGKIHRGTDGMPNGILIDKAMDGLLAFDTLESDSQVEEYVQTAVRHAHSLGITSIHDAGATGQQIETIRQLLKKKKVAFRFYEMLSLKDTATWEKYMLSGPELDAEDGQLTVRAVKFFADGAMGSRGAAFREPYNDDPKNKGLLMMNEAQMVEAFKKVDQAGFQIAIHAIGSLANHTAINALEKALGSTIHRKRPRLEHTQVLEKNDIQRVARLGITASMQPTHCTSDMKWVVQRIGRPRARYAYAWASLLNAKANIAFGSDAPVELLNPWHGLYASLTRQDKEGKPASGFFPMERIGLTDAFKAFTSGAAYASHSELMQGRLTNGSWADLIVLDRDPFALKPSELREIQVLQTWIGGKKVFEAAPPT